MKHLIILFVGLISIACWGQYENEPSEAYPFGKPHPNAPKEIMDFQPMIGICDCTSITRNKDQSWAAPNTMTWEFKYIMNGMAVQDETLKEDGKHSGSIRQFIQDSSKWYVHYYSSSGPTPVLSAWEGNKKDDRIILYKEQKAPNGMEGYYKINFYDITEEGFKWLGEWVNTNESFSYPTWKIDCIKRKDTEKVSDEDQIRNAAKSFSAAYLKKDFEAIANAYTKDAKIFPNNTPIIKGYEAIKKRWSGGADSYTPIAHEIIPEEIVILNDTAHDYGIYKGKNKRADGTEISYQGKYVVVWKKENNQWKMYLDIWNTIKD